MTAKASTMAATGYGYHDSVGTASHMHSHETHPRAQQRDSYALID